MQGIAADGTLALLPEEVPSTCDVVTPMTPGTTTRTYGQISRWYSCARFCSILVAKSEASTRFELLNSINQHFIIITSVLD